MATIVDLVATGEVDGTSLNDLMLIGLAYNATIEGLGGNDTIIVGKSTNSLIDGGEGNDKIVVLSTGPGTTTMIGGIGNDILVGGNLSCGSGDLLMYGDVGNVLNFVPLYLFFNQNSFTNQVVVFTVPPTGFGDDIMYAYGSEGAFMCGDTGTFASQVAFQTSQTGANQQQSLLFELTFSVIALGNDRMYGSAGNDIMNGDADTSPGFTLAPGTTPGTTAIADGVNSRASAIFYTDKNIFDFGNDKIFGGEGNDLINGDLNIDAHEAAFGVATATNGGTAFSILTTSDDRLFLGDDFISGGGGKDSIYGDGKVNSHDAFGGTAYADGVGSVARVIDIVGIDVHDRVTPAPLQSLAGNDVINGDSGDDSLYGDFYLYYNAAHGGTATAVNGGVASSRYTVDGTVFLYGNDTLSGGTGNDKIVGDVLTTELEVVAGQANGVGASVTVEIKNFTQIMGDDIISAGSGNDLVIGDCLEYILPYAGLTVSTVSGHVRVADSNNNSITWGNDTMSAGTGIDNFFTAVALSTDPIPVLVAQGFDVISNFSVSNDKLTFVGTDMTTLLGHTSLAYSGPDTIINFDGGAGGSITLQNVFVNNMSNLNIDVFANASSVIGLFPQ